MSLWSISNPLGEALETITGQPPPVDLTGVTAPGELSEAVMLRLLDWCSDNAQPDWATGESIYDAAWLMVDRASENDNI